MKTCYMYSFVAPLDPELKDDGTVPPLGVVPVVITSRSTGVSRHLEAAILGIPNTVKAFRFTIPDVNGETLDPDDYKRFLRYRNFMLDAIRICYEPTAEYFRHGDNVYVMYHFREPGESPALSLRIAEPINPDYRVNVEGLQRLFAAPDNLRPMVHLIADGGNFHLPIHFRFLSFYKIIEMHYKTITPNKTFCAFLKPLLPIFQAEYPDVTTCKQACSILKSLRDRCAHIVVGRGDLGFSHIAAEQDEVFKAMPIVRHVAIKAIRVNHPDAPLQFSASPDDFAETTEEMKRRGQQPQRLF
jgi:hypothetical protein